MEGFQITFNCPRDIQEEVLICPTDRHLYTVLDSSIESRESLDCPICIDTLETNNIISLDCCNNKFHIECLYKWIQGNACCPICRDITNIKTKLDFLMNIDKTNESINESLPLITTNRRYTYSIIYKITFIFFIGITILFYIDTFKDESLKKE